MSNETVPFCGCSLEDKPLEFKGETRCRDKMKVLDWNHLYFFSKKYKQKSIMKFFITLVRSLLFRSYLDFITVGLVQNRSCLLGVLVFNFGMFDLACGRFGKLAMLFPSGGSPISNTCKLLSSEWKNPSSEIGFTYAS